MQHLAELSDETDLGNTRHQPKERTQDVKFIFKEHLSGFSTEESKCCLQNNRRGNGSRFEKEDFAESGYNEHI